MNVMRNVELDKVVLHICAGEFGPKLENAKKILGLLSKGRKPVDTKAKARLPKWGLRPGLVIGSKLTLRGNEAYEFLKKAIKAKGTINSRSFDKNGNFAFGIREYIDIEGMKYDPKMGVMGFDVIVSLKRKGARVKVRRIKPTKLGANTIISKAEAQDFLKNEFNAKVE